MELGPQPERESGAPAESPRRWFHRESISLAEIAVQTFSVVLGILLALAIGEWSKDREQRTQIDDALHAVRAEIESNRAEVAKGFKLIADSDAEMAKLTTASTSSVPRPCPETPGWHGIAYPLLLDAAYQTTIATQTLAHMDFNQAQNVARVYGKQREFLKYADHVIEFVASRSLPVEGCRYVLATEERKNLQELDSTYAAFLQGTEPGR